MVYILSGNWSINQIDTKTEEVQNLIPYASALGVIHVTANTHVQIIFGHYQAEIDEISIKENYKTFACQIAKEMGYDQEEIVVSNLQSFNCIV